MEHVKEMLSEYLDRELPKEESRRLESHLAACSECRRELEELGSVSKLVQSLPREPLPAGFLQRLERRRREADAPAPTRFFLPVPARVAAFALSSIVVMFVIYQKLENTFPTPETSVAETSVLETAGAPAASAREGRASYDEALRPKTSPKAARRLTGTPLGESAAAPRAYYTNEALHQALESEKARMGIRNILARSATQARMAALGGMGAGSSAGGTAGASLEAVRLPPPAPVLPGNTPTLLSASGQQSSVDTFTLPPRLLIRSPREQAKAWQEQSITTPPPEVDYARQMLVLVLSQDEGASVEIIGTVQLPDRLIIRYRKVPLSPQASTPYQFRVLPKNDLPVLFQKLP